MIKIHTDIKNEIEPKLTEVKEKFRSRIMKSVINAGVSAVKKEVKKDISGKVLKKKTGNLYKGLNHRTFKDGNAIIFDNAPHAHLLEDGAEVKTKNKKYLTFKIENKWVKVKSVKIQGRKFLINRLQGFPTQTAYAAMEKKLQEMLEKYKNKE